MKKIEILGTGCPLCIKLEEQVDLAIRELGVKKFEINKITEINDILNYGVMMIPALVIDGEIKFKGNLPPFRKIKEYINS